MNKQKMILAIIGGGFGLAVLVMGCLVFNAYSAKNVAEMGDEEEGTEGLQTVVANAEQLSRKAIYPCQASVTALESNLTAITEWREAALKQASRGDRFFDKTTAAAFKTMIVADAKRLKQLPGAVNGRLLKSDFAFGPFHDYIGGGKMPEDSALAVLQRQWDDIALVIEALGKCGAAEVTAVELKAAEIQAEATNVKGKNAKKSSVKKAKAKAAAPADADSKAPQTFTYVFNFNAKPEAFVKALNAFATSERFIVVDDFGFTRPQDPIAKVLGGEAKKTEAATQSGSRRSRRRGAAAAEPKKDEAEKDKQKSGVVTDPLTDAPLAVTMRLTISDFRSLEENEAEKKEEVGK